MAGRGMRGRGGCAWQRGHAWLGGCVWQGGMCGGGGTCVAGETATAANGTHPTEMHSCYINCLNTFLFRWQEPG